MSRYHYHGRRYGKMRAFASGFGGVLNVFGGPLPPILKRPRRSMLDDAANLKRDGERVAVFTLNDAKEENHDHSEE